MMLQGVSAPIANSFHGAAPPEAPESGGDDSCSGGGGGGGGGSCSVVGSITARFKEEEKGRTEEGERNSDGNRWPRQETLALLKIRSEMDVAFRDSSLKGPLWEEVSRKLGKQGYHRSSKKCKEKFENVYKYHKRTKDGRTSKPVSKTYRFFDQLEALEGHPSLSLPSPMKPQAPMAMAATTAMAVAVAVPNTITYVNSPTVPQVAVVSTSVSQNIVTPIINPTNPLPPLPPQPNPQPQLQPQSKPMISTNPKNPSSDDPYMFTSLMSNSTSSSTSSDEEPQRQRKRKREWKYFFGRLMKEVIRKQEELQKKILETLEKREHHRMMREEAWRMQEMAKMNREHDLLVQERSISAARDAAVIAFLQKITEQQNPQDPIATPKMQMQVQVQQNPLPLQLQLPPPPPPPPPQPQQLVATSENFLKQPLAAAAAPLPTKNSDTPKTDDGGDMFTQTTKSRWPKPEIIALIRLRTTLDTKYQENGPKGHLWEEISAEMRKLGYDRNAKRCKEKWENINKYFKKMKESNKKRSEDAKTCPYFNMLEAIYKEKALVSKPDQNAMVPIMVRPEQQWPLPQQHHQLAEPSMNNHGDINQNHEDITGDDEDEEEEEQEDEAGGYEIVANKTSSVATVD